MKRWIQAMLLAAVFPAAAADLAIVDARIYPSPMRRRSNTERCCCATG